jgi:formylglycine-generating enzyme required for sulfatase activity
MSSHDPNSKEKNIRIRRDVKGGVVNIGGEQKHEGDVIINHPNHPEGSSQALLAFLAFLAFLLIVVLVIIVVFLLIREPVVQPTPTSAEALPAITATASLDAIFITQTYRAEFETATTNTNTPAATFTPTLISTPNLPATAVAHAYDRVNTNAEWQQYYPEGFVQAFNGVEMVLVPAGCFRMGNDDEREASPSYHQCFVVPFWIDKYEVTNQQFNFLGRVSGLESKWIEPQRPRERITWFEARDFCQKRGMRLPTEREWEYAARGPDALLYPWGNNFVPRNLVYSSNSDEQTASAGSHPNGKSWVGALDMAGNVWEWTGSWYADYPYDVNDGREDQSSKSDAYTERAVRGGSWYDVMKDVRTYHRHRNFPEFTNHNIGFRCARSIP